MRNCFQYILKYSHFSTIPRPSWLFRNPCAPFPSKHFNTMAASASQTLAQKLSALSLEGDLPIYPNCYPEINPFDIYRAHLTSILTPITGVDSSIVYPALRWTDTLEKGDLNLPIQALRIKGKKPAELGAEWLEKVILSHVQLICKRLKKCTVS